MASTYSTSLRLELMATGDQSGTWGDTTNTNLGTLLEQAITGVLSVAQGDVANLTLTNLNGASDQARNAVINLTGAMTAARNVVVPAPNKLYLIKNSTTGGFAVTVKTPSGTGVTIPAGTAQWVYADGTNVVQGLSGTMAVQAPDAVAITGGTATGFTSLSSSSSTEGFVGFQTISTEAGAAAGPIIDLYRNSATPAANDILGQVLFTGEDSAGNTQEYASIQAVIVDPTSTSEDSTLDLYALLAGSRTLMLSVGGGAASGIYVPGVIDIGNASDTTLSRASAGVLAVEGNAVITTATKIVLGTDTATTSGSSVTLASIPATAKQITLSWRDGQINATGTFGVQIGDSGGLETTGYVGQRWSGNAGANPDVAAWSTNALWATVVSAEIVQMTATLTLVNASSNTWQIEMTGGTGSRYVVSNGYKALSATLDRVALVTSAAFSAGSLNIAYG